MTYDYMTRRMLLLSAIGVCLWTSGCAGPMSWLKRDGKQDIADAGQSVASKQAAKNPKLSKAKFSQQFSKARGLEAEKNYDQARSVYEALIVNFPERYEPYHRLAVVADRQRRHREAEALYAESIRLSPMKGELFGDLGYCYFLQGQMTKAESALVKAVAMEPAESRHRNNLGLVYGNQGKIEEALASFRRAGSEADAQYNLAFVLASMDRGEEAKRCFQAALMADPTHEKSAAALASFERYESLPEEIRDEFSGSSDGRWVRYVEGGDDASAVQPASAVAPAPALTSRNRQAGR